MAKRPNLTDITNVLNSASTHNANNDEIELAFDNTLSRDGSTPNQMGADFDMNSNDIINVDNVHANNIVVTGLTLSSDSVVFPKRTAAFAAAMASALTNGQVGFMEGLAYEKDSTATGTASATNDLSVNGLVPYGHSASVLHFGMPFSPTDGTAARMAAQTWVNDTDGTLAVPKGTYLTDSTTYVVPHAFEWRQGDFQGGVTFFDSARNMPMLVTVETTSDAVLDGTKSKVGINVSSIARGGQHADAIRTNLTNFSTDGAGNTSLYANSVSDVLASWTASTHSESRHGGGTSIGSSVEMDPFSTAGNMYGMVLNNVASGGLATHPTTGASKALHPTITGLYVQGAFSSTPEAGWQYGIRFASDSMHSTGSSIRMDAPTARQIHVTGTADSSVADIVLEADSAAGILLNGAYTNDYISLTGSGVYGIDAATGTFSGGVMRVGDNNSINFNNSGTVKVGWNTSGAQLEFADGATVRMALTSSGDSLSIRVNSLLKQVTQGANDSGGAGFAVLRVAN